MILVLYDDLAIGVFGSTAEALKGLEGIDIENNEYSFCNDEGQRFVGVVTRKRGLFRQGEVALRPEGEPDAANTLALLGRAVRMTRNDRFSDLESLRRHLAQRDEG